MSISRPAYVPSLDGVRGVAVLLVIVYHCWTPALPGGLVGVDLFFVLSGFLITTLLLRERAETGRVWLPGFYARRALRLLPALAVVLLVCTLYARLNPGWRDAAPTLQGVRGTLTYTSNWMFASQVRLGMLTHSWSLSVEEQFYVVWPLVLIGLIAWGRERAALLACLVGAGAVVAERSLMVLHGVPWQRMYGGFDTRADALLIGCALALAAELGLLRRVPKLLMSAVALAGAICIGWMAARLDGPGALAPWRYLLVAVCAAGVVAALAVRPSRGPHRLLELWPLVATGRVSYGLYLWHVPILAVVGRTWTELTRPAALLITLTLSLAVAALSDRLIERPCNALRGRLRPVRRPARAQGAPLRRPLGRQPGGDLRGPGPRRDGREPVLVAALQGRPGTGEHPGQGDRGDHVAAVGGRLVDRLG
jgi:peptidoglycan/LPS O-acetylase OafA/YrhL